MSGIFGSSQEDRFHERELDRWLDRSSEPCPECDGSGKVYEEYHKMVARVRWVGIKFGPWAMMQVYRKWRRAGGMIPCPECSD